MKRTAAYLRQKAARCRELADVVAERHSSLAATLREIADEFDAQARALGAPDAVSPELRPDADDEPRRGH